VFSSTQGLCVSLTPSMIVLPRAEFIPYFPSLVS
jgi:hypothetical protein